MVVDETSWSLEVPLAVDRDSDVTLSGQVEGKLRDAIRAGALVPGAQLPSTRDLAAQLGVSRRIVVESYAQLAAEGYLALRRGARPRVAASASTRPDRQRPVAAPDAAPPRYDLRPSVPDVSAFPRQAWMRSLRHAVTTISDADLGYGDPRGVRELRVALAEYVGRVRGVVAEPERIVITSGYSQGLGLVCRALAQTRGARRIALETPNDAEYQAIAARAGLTAVAVDVDADGLVVDALRDADAVALTPAHQNPTSVLLSADRRLALVDWLHRRDAVAVEDDYDAEYRYDRAAVGALQGLAPDHVVYAGSLSKTLAPALRLGWLVVPAGLVDAVVAEKLLADRGGPRIEQLAFADFLRRGELDRHLRRMRIRYRERRGALVAALTAQLPDVEVIGIAAGLYLAIRLPVPVGGGLAEASADARLALEVPPDPEATALALGYAQLLPAAAAPAVRALAAALGR